MLSNSNPITTKKTSYNRVTRNYVYSEKELKQLKYQVGSQYLETYLKNITEDENGNYLIADNSETNSKINLAIKRDYNFFNKENKNYREVYFDSFGSVEVFKIEDIEYLIESRESENHTFSIHIYNFEYAEKWLKQLNNLLGNYRFGTLKGIKEDIVKDSQKKGINKIDNIAVIIENLFFHCLDFHNNQKFERVANHNIEKYELFNYINTPGGIFWWKQKKEEEVNNCVNSLITELEELFISVSLRDFMQIRDFINLWIEKIISITINNETKMFEWAYSPFMETVFNLNEKITKLFSDKRIKLKNSLQSTTTTTEIESTDLSDTNAVQKVIYLNELGVIDFLRKTQPFNTSVNSLATVLSAITGVKTGTLQPYLNAMISKTNADKNDPYNTESTVNKVKIQLSKIGFQPK